MLVAVNAHDEDVTATDFWSPRMVKLRAVSEQILSQTVEQRILQIEAEANFFATVRRVERDV